MSEYLDMIHVINHKIDEVNKKMIAEKNKINKLWASRAEYNIEYSKQFVGKCFESHSSYYLIIGPAEPQYTLAGFIHDDDKMPAIIIKKEFKSLNSICSGEIDIGAVEMMEEISPEVLKRAFVGLIDKIIKDVQKSSQSCHPRVLKTEV